MVPRDWNEVDGLDLKRSRPCKLYITDGTMDAVGHKGVRGATLELARTVLETVQGECFASGWRGVTDYDSEQGDEDWTVYVARPNWRYRNSGQKAKPWKGEDLFLVFVDGEGVIRWWFWDHPSPDNPKFPVDYADRFKEQLL